MPWAAIVVVNVLQSRTNLFLAVQVLCGALLEASLGAQETKPATSRPAALTRPQDVPIPTDQEATSSVELTLADALRIGRRSNTNLAALELLPMQAREDLRGARAFFEPELYGEAGAGKTQDPSRNIFVPEITRETYDGKLGWRQRVASGGLFDLAFTPTKVHQTTTSPGFPVQQFTSDVTLTFTQPLLRGAWSDYALRNVRIGEAVVAGAEHKFRKNIQDTLLETTRAYWELVFARENYRVVFLALDLAREQLRITNERIRVRELAERDRVADEADVARRKEELITAENVIRAREDALRRLIYDDKDGLLWKRPLRPTSPLHEAPAVSGVEWQSLAETALRRRPDLMSKRSEISQAEIQLEAAERDLLPKFDLVSSYSTDGTRGTFNDAWSDTWSADYPDWSVRLQFAIPIGNHAALASRDKQKLVVEQKKRELYVAELDVAREVRDAVRELTTLALRIQAALESVRLGETNLDTERQKLRVGLSTAFEVQRRNQELREARSRLLRNQLDFEIATAVLLHVQGLLSGDDPALTGKRP